MNRLQYPLLAILALFTLPAFAQDRMIRIAGGTFMMGSENGLADERPANLVSVRPFLIDRLAVTNRDYAAFLNRYGHKPREGRIRYFDLEDNDTRIRRMPDGRFVPFDGHADMPVTEVSWFGARDYCAALGKRLPTEAEREFAARGASGRIYPWGNEAPTDKHAQFDKSWGDMSSVAVHQAGATPEGVLGLAGNVHEWTSSLYRPYPYPADDGREDTASGEERVTRGGAHDNAAAKLRAAWRGDGESRSPQGGHHNIGFRCAKSAPEG